MTEAILPNVQGFLTTDIGTEGQLLIPRKIHDTLIESVDKALIPRSEAAQFIGPSGIPGSSIDIDLMTPNTMDVRETPEGSEIVLDNEEYTSFNMKPVKYGVAIRITKELQEELAQKAKNILKKAVFKEEGKTFLTKLIDYMVNRGY